MPRQVPFPGVGTLVRKWEENVKTFFTPGVSLRGARVSVLRADRRHDIDALMDTFAGGEGHERSPPHSLHHTKGKASRW